ncbi:hypothetical protein A4F85_01250 [Delftia sp. GW456-R20]|nr:hypothetical protein A4F85_01250 [Delftia sp. GW456-R20]
MHEDASEPVAEGKLAAAHAQRVGVMDDVMAQMLLYGKRTMDRDELDANVAIMIDHIWQQLVG